MSNVIGSFVFRDEGDGCLTGKYINRGLTTPVTECCKRRSDASLVPFEGSYITVWIEGTVIIVSTDLRITRVGDLFDLLWTRTDTDITVFTGKAMLHGDLLVGCYWD